MMGLVASTDAEVEFLLAYLEDVIFEGLPEAFTTVAYGVPVCPDGRDRSDVIAACGCVVRHVYDHSNVPLPGFTRCSKSSGSRQACGGWRAAVPEVAEVYACPLHEPDLQDALRGWWSTEMEQLRD